MSCSFPSTQQYRGTGALLKFSLVEESKRAIQVLNGAMLPGCVQPLLVRFADSPAEKAAKASRKERVPKKAMLNPFGAVDIQNQWVRSVVGTPFMSVI